MAIPLIVSTSSWTVMNFIDRMFLLRYSEASMAAVLPAGMVHFAIVSFPLGVASYTSTFVAQYHGAGHPRRIGPAVWQGIRVGLYCLPLFLAMIPLSPWIFRLAGHETGLARLEAVFFRTALFGAAAEVIAVSMAAFFSGRGVTWVVMVVDSSAWALNIVLDYGWIFGHLGLPALGIEGQVHGFGNVRLSGDELNFKPRRQLKLLLFLVRRDRLSRANIFGERIFGGPRRKQRQRERQ